jgi:GDP-4-dehydro-6-deoxy-D-mannose reductase
LKALITGAGGFVAAHLARELVSGGWEVHGCGLSHDGDLRHDSMPASTAGLHGFASFRSSDVADPESMREVLRETTPDAVFHLAGISSVAAAQRDPAQTFRSNCTGTIVLLQEIAAARQKSAASTASAGGPVCLVVGSSEQYGSHDASRMPLSESECLRPVSTYATSKVAQEQVALQMALHLGLRVICVRSFNHSGAGQRRGFLLPDLVSRTLEVRRNGGKSLPIGNASPVRDFLHVFDVVRAYKLLVERGEAGQVYNVCSGKGWSVRELAALVLARCGVDARIDETQEHKRQVDVAILVGNNSRLAAATGWKPSRTIDDIIEDLIDAAAK